MVQYPYELPCKQNWYNASIPPFPALCCAFTSLNPAVKHASSVFCGVAKGVRHSSQLCLNISLKNIRNTIYYILCFLLWPNPSQYTACILMNSCIFIFLSFRHFHFILDCSLTQKKLWGHRTRFFCVSVELPWALICHISPCIPAKFVYIKLSFTPVTGRRSGWGEDVCWMRLSKWFSRQGVSHDGVKVKAVV